MTFICQRSFHNNSSNITDHQRTVTISEIHKTLFIWAQHLVVLCKYLIKLKLLSLLKNFPRGCTEFPEFFTFVKNLREVQVFQICVHPLSGWHQPCQWQQLLPSPTIYCYCNWGTCTASPTRRPRAHHRVNPYPGDRKQNETEMFSDHDETSPSIAAVSAPSAACSMLAVQ